MKQVILPLTYLGPTAFYAKLIGDNDVVIEQMDSYHKQTYRNRCAILAANGLLNLSIPVVKQSGVKVLVKDVQIDYDTRWQDNHWRSICSAYNSSPFFEYYADELAPFYMRETQFLIDFNLEIMATVLDLMQVKVHYRLSDDFLKSYNDAEDLRTIISPKNGTIEADCRLNLTAYTQTFDEKFGFISNLSILDLLFNKGPEALSYLKQATK